MTTVTITQPAPEGYRYTPDVTDHLGDEIMITGPAGSTLARILDAHVTDDGTELELTVDLDEPPPGVPDGAGIHSTDLTIDPPPATEPAPEAEPTVDIG